jgi:signal recognition particle GTPase
MRPQCHFGSPALADARALMCWRSVVDELGIPIKFVGVGETVDDLQPFDAAAFVDALFPAVEQTAALS